jgi:hypothetical protein
MQRLYKYKRMDFYFNVNTKKKEVFFFFYKNYKKNRFFSFRIILFYF